MKAISATSSASGEAKMRELVELHSTILRGCSIIRAFSTLEKEEIKTCWQSAEDDETVKGRQHPRMGYQGGKRQI
jgi:hypothetical protein